MTDIPAATRADLTAAPRARTISSGGQMGNMVRCAATALALGGCAMITTKRLPDNYAPKYEPRCDPTNGWVFVDVVTLIADGVLIGYAIGNPKGNLTSSDRAELGVENGLEGALSLTSILVASKWMRECKRAQDAWDHGGQDAALAALEDRREQRERALHPGPPVVVAPPLVLGTNDPRGAVAFWCDSGGACFVSIADCGENCESAPTAWCASYGEGKASVSRCYRHQSGCVTAIDEAQTDERTFGACEQFSARAR